MLLKENVKIKCRKCNGKGYTGKEKFTLEHKDINDEFKLICMHCLGIGKVDWIEQITGKKLTINNRVGGAFFMMRWIDINLLKDNWMYKYNGNTYYIYHKFFDDHDSTEEKMKNFIIHINA